MVQRNMTPGGDKNGADITMALDALEMAFTHDHINTFVIVGGDSDFISLVEKLKQYGRNVLVVGGRQFTSITLQRNCHEFIAYENLAGASAGSSSRGGRATERGGRPSQTTGDISKALPIVMRALKVLSDREVTPQLGLLKSTLLQLDSTFSEREFGAGSFRDFMEKVAETGAVTLKQAGRSMLVEAREDGAPIPETVKETVAPSAPEDPDIDEEQMPVSPMTMQDGIRAVQTAFAQGTPPPRFPMYVRQAKQYLRNAIPGFDERKYGFASVVDLLRAAGKEGVLRVERDRQGAVRVFPGTKVTPPMLGLPVDDPDMDETLDVSVAEPVIDAEAVAAETVADAPIVDVEPLAVGEAAGPEGDGSGRKGARKRKASAPRAPKAPRTKAAAPRGRKAARAKAEAADRE